MNCAKTIITGDIHRDITRLENLNAFGEFTKEDIVIVLGDFGVVWGFNNDLELLERLGKLNFTVAFVDGNHENFDKLRLCETHREWNGGIIGLLPYDIIHLLRGQIYTINGKRVGVMGGAESVDKGRRIEGYSWWADEAINQNNIIEFKNNLGSDLHLDLMLTHDCPASLVPQIKLYAGINNGNITQSQKYLEEINEMADIDNWYFGHWHTNVPLNHKFRCLYSQIMEV